MKRLVKLGMGFFIRDHVANRCYSYEVMNMIRKGQMYGVDKEDILSRLTFSFLVDLQ